MSNVCELPHEYATARTMHVSIAVSSDRGMCKHVVRRGAGATAGTMMIEIESCFFFSARADHHQTNRPIRNRPNRLTASMPSGFFDASNALFSVLPFEL